MREIPVIDAGIVDLEVEERPSGGYAGFTRTIMARLPVASV